MADLKKVMQKLNSQKSEKEEKPKKKKVVEEEQEDFEEEEEQEDSEEEPKEESEEKEAEKILSSVEKLQNDGVFRYNLLSSINAVASELKLLNYQINKALSGEDGGEEKEE